MVDAHGEGKGEFSRPHSALKSTNTKNHNVPAFSELEIMVSTTGKVTECTCVVECHRSLYSLLVQ